MAILAPFPVLEAPPEVDPIDRTETRTLGFRSLDGTEFLPWTGREFIGMEGMTGLDLPPVEVIKEQQYGDEGARIIEMRYKSRDIFIPLFLRSDSGHLDYLRNKRARLLDLFDFALVDYAEENGTFDIVANSADGRNERSLRCHYVSGLEGNLTKKTERSTYSALGLKLEAVKPYWQGETWSTPKISRPTGGSWFDEFPGELSMGRTLGADITVTVPGNAASWPRIPMAGPAPSVEVSGPGLYFRIPDGLADGEVAYIETTPGRRTAMFNGVEQWSRVAPQRQWGRMKPGDNTFNLDLGDAGAAAYAYVSGRAQWKTPW